MLPPFELLRLMVYQNETAYEYICFVDQMYITDVYGNTVDHVALDASSALSKSDSYDF